YAQELHRKSLDLTLYTNGFGIVHDQREIDIEQGVSDIIIGEIPRDISPETIHGEFDGDILSQNYSFQEAHWPEVILRQLTGKMIRLISDNGDLVEGILHSHKYGQVWLEGNDGNFIFIPNTHNYRLHTSISPNLLRLDRELKWTVNSNNSGLQ